MKTNYLFPSKFKTIGWFLFLPSVVLGLVTIIFDLDPNFMNFRVPAIFISEFSGDKKGFGMVDNNIWNELVGVLLIISSLLVAFSKEKLEDEYISKIRLESLVWAVYVNYGILLIAFLFIYDLSFFPVMILNLFTVLLFFIVRFNWQIAKLKMAASYEE